MTIEEAKQLLDQNQTGFWDDAWPNEMIIDGTFTLEQVEALAVIARAKKEAQVKVV